MPLRIANAAGFLGDNLDAPRRLLESACVDFLTLEYLAELTLSILARARQRDPLAGFARDFLDVLGSLLPAWRAQRQLRIVTNAGGVNPLACARAAARILAAAGMGDVRIGVVTGDDLLGRLEELVSAGCPLTNLDTGRPLADVRPLIVSAHAYLGARPIAEALAGGAQLVVTGRVADASLTVGPAVDRFGWQWDDWDRLAAASVAGHLIECGAQVTGGLYTHWDEVDLEEVGYPIAELEGDGALVITKPAGSGGCVNRETVVEQLVYEIGDPAHYLTPDVDVDFTTVEVAGIGPDRVAVAGASGRPATDSYKVSLAYSAGYTASGQLLVYGPDCVAKARTCADIVLARLKAAGYEYQRVQVECLGAGEGVPSVNTGGRFLPINAGCRAESGPPSERTESPREIVLRIAVEDPRRDAVERFTRELVPLATSGPAGLAGYTTARGSVRPVLAYWPTLVPKCLVEPRVEVRPAWQWSQDRGSD